MSEDAKKIRAALEMARDIAMPASATAALLALDRLEAENARLRQDLEARRIQIETQVRMDFDAIRQWELAMLDAVNVLRVATAPNNAVRKRIDETIAKFETRRGARLTAEGKPEAREANGANEANGVTQPIFPSGKYGAEAKPEARSAADVAREFGMRPATAEQQAHTVDEECGIAEGKPETPAKCEKCGHGSHVGRCGAELADDSMGCSTHHGTSCGCRMHEAPAPATECACPARLALEEAKKVMDHFGDVLNGMDCVREVEAETGVSNDWVYGVFAQVDAVLATPCECAGLRGERNQLRDTLAQIGEHHLATLGELRAELAKLQGKT